LGMALDEPQEGDVVFEEDGFSFVIDKQLYEMAKPIRIDSETVDAKEVLSISCILAENTCSIAEDPDSCQGYCNPCFCQL